MITLCENETTPGSASTLIRGLNPLLTSNEKGSAVKATRVCSVDGCDRPYLALGYCNPHYLRRKRSGSPDGDGGPLRDEIPTECTVPGCDRPYEAHGMCGSHRRMVRTGRPVGPIESRGGDLASYVGAHNRVRTKRGPAAGYPCSHCPSQAAEWAYDHADPNEKLGPVKSRGRDLALPYSEDPAHYMPLCKPCHTRFDRRAT